MDTTQDVQLSPFYRWARRGFTTGHTQYVQLVQNLVGAGYDWLDAGGGRRIFHDPEDGEKTLVNRARTVTAADLDMYSLRNHESVTDRACCDLGRLPFATGSFDLVTCAMVVEHLTTPEVVLADFARVMRSGALLVIHTPNLWGHSSLAAVLLKMLPKAVRRRLIRLLTGRYEEDIFETHYACNTKRRLSNALMSAGLTIASAERIPAGATFRRSSWLAGAEIVWARLLMALRMDVLLGQLLVVARKP